MSEAKNEIVVYQPNETMRLEVRLENEMVWLNRHQMARLFGRDVKTIGKHIANALSEELSSMATADGISALAAPGTSDFATTQHRQSEIGREVLRLTKCDALAIPIIKAASDYGDGGAAQLLAEYWLGRGNYRKAAEFALTCWSKEILEKCFVNCQPEELDDIKRRMAGPKCKNFDPMRKVCVISGTYCQGDLCDWQCYTEA